MNQPLGKFVGNALEVYECLQIMRGEADPAMMPSLELSVELTARLLVMCGIAESDKEAKGKLQHALDSGEALERFRQNIELQGGDPRICDLPERLLDKKLVQVEIKAAGPGFIAGIDALAIGEAVGAIGGGRVRAEDKVDHAVGYECRAGIGSKLEKDDVLGVLYCRNKNHADAVTEKLRAAYTIGSKKVKSPQLVKNVIV